ETDSRAVVRGRAAGQRHVLAADDAGDGATGDRRIAVAVVDLVRSREAARQLLGRDARLRGQRVRRQRVVALVGAAQDESATGHVLVGTDVLVVELRRAARERHVLPSDHAGDRATRDRRLALAVVDLG